MGRTARFFFIAAFQGATSIVPAHEGMWLPTVLGSIQDRMQAEGLELTAEDIYSANNGSLKDAIVLFGGGCTAEVISGDGLILTNHHCGFGSIQEHSALDHDYLKNGFWAMDRAAELKNPGLSATFIIRMEDVTEKMLATVPVGASEGERQQALATAGASFAKEAIAEGHYNAVVRAFNYGLQFILIISETFPDVRLVGAPLVRSGNSVATRITGCGPGIRATSPCSASMPGRTTSRPTRDPAMCPSDQGTSCLSPWEE
ncbi:MAG: S46 family peptidase [Flavobacteriales bacterium]|nr:S46 family peptidase [Flavobacteriales bacterium]